MEPNFDYYYNALAGKKQMTFEGEPQNGFYKRRKFKGGPWLPVAIWQDKTNGEYMATVDGESVDPVELWNWVCGNPITYEAFTYYSEHSKWPDDIEPLAGIGDNNPPEGSLTIKEQISSAEKAALEVIKNGINSQTEADKAANHRDRLMGLSKDADKQRIKLRKPHMDAAKAVQDEWKPLVDSATSAANKVRGAITVYLNKVETERLEAERKAKVEADRLAKEAVEREAAGKPPAPEPTPPPIVQSSPVRAGTNGRAISLRTTRRAEITDYKLLLETFAEKTEVKELIQKLANAAARANIEVKGMKIIEERKAA